MASSRQHLLTVRQVRAIAAVAEHVSLAQASMVLNISQSSLSRHIAEAERGLKHRLFQRGWSGMEPTTRGAIVISHCRRMAGAFLAAQVALDAAGAHPNDLSHHFNWEMFDVLDAVRTTGSASTAAQYLEISQPDVSRGLARINAATGRPAFHRTRSGMAASADVPILSNLHAALLAEEVTLTGRLEELDGEVTGRVAVGLLPFSEQDVVIRVFSQIMKRHSHARLQAVTGSYGALTDGLRKGELDFVLGPLRNPAPFDMLEEAHLLNEQITMVARTDHPRICADASLAALVDESWVVGPHGTPTRRYFEDLLLSQGFEPPTQICELVTFSLAEEMVRSSDAIGLLTYSSRKQPQARGGLVALSMDLPNATRSVGLTYRLNLQQNDIQITFRNLLERELETI